MKLLNNKDLVKHTPIATTILFESANLQHVFRMVSEHSSAGQSLAGWVTVNVALLLWFNWYRVFTPDNNIVKWTTITGMLLNTVVIGTIVRFRYFA